MMEFFTNADIYLLFLFNGLAGVHQLVNGAIVFFAEYLPFFLIALLVIVFCRRGPFREAVSICVLALSAGFIARFIVGSSIRFLYERPRPFIAFDNIKNLFLESSHSFPSGHALFFFALSAVVYSYNKHWGIVFFVSSLIMGLARIAGGVHYPSDILGGALIGAFVGCGLMRVVQKYSSKNNKL